MKRRIVDLIHIPERVQKGDFVLGLTDGVKDARATLAEYVVTDQLVTCFDDALSFIRSGLEAGSSKASFLHGSFGSGKSHFMAVLHLLLSHNPDARSVAKLAPVVAKHAPWLDGRKLLLVPTHMIGAPNIESRVFDDYVRTVQARHPEAPLPGVYLADRLFANASEIRQHQGDDAFFRMLNRGRGALAGWGKIATGWDAARFDEALRAPPGHEQRHRLVGDLVANVLTAFRDLAASQGEGFVTLDEGLSIISRHAKSLGYDGIVLFLDELILWLATHVANMGFINREGSKLSKLVESANANRPVPILSFVARQRDLRELVGSHVPGAEQLGFADVLKHWEDRFHRIHLEDKNLPDIVAHRLLRPRSDEAGKEMRRAFGELSRLRDEVLQTLLTSEADRAMFEKVYPFSPALLQTMIAVSSALQRTRTAIRLLLQLLVTRREDLAVGDVLPVGDLWDVIADGDEPFMDVMRTNFERARKLYTQKLRPLIEAQHGLSAEAVRALPDGDPRRAAFRADDRVAKTLLLGALVPEVESLKALTAGRLAALNYGSVVSNIPGREGKLVLERVRDWSTKVGEVRVTDERDPVIQIQLTGVDTDSILQRVQNQDNSGQRRQMVKRLLFSMLGIPEQDTLIPEHKLLWRGTWRRIEVVYANVREMSESQLRASGDAWRVVIDYPFDEPPHGPADDRAVIEKFQGRAQPTRTFVWLPRFFTRQTLADLGTLVVLDYLLTGERFGDAASHLSVQDRATARGLLDSQRSQLEQRVRQAILEAYGVTGTPERAVLVENSHGLDQTFQCLEDGLTVTPPVAATLQDALQRIVSQLLAFQYPDHPEFPEEIKTTLLKKVWEEVRRATQARDGRINVLRDLRGALRAVANPLRLGEMTDGDAFVLGHDWRLEFEKRMAQEPGELTVKRLRVWMDEPKKRGLPREVQNLVLLTFAWQTNRAFFQFGGPVEGRIENIPDDWELRHQSLPEEADWAEARRRVEPLFGLRDVSELLSAANANDLATRIQKEVGAVREGANQLVPRLVEWYRAFGLDETRPGRLKTARTALGLVEALVGVDVNAVIRALARASLSPAAQTVGTSLKQAALVAGALSDSRLQVIAGALRLSDARQAEAEALAATVRDVLHRDELAMRLEPVLVEAERKAVRLLAPPSPPPPAAPNITVSGARDARAAGPRTRTVSAGARRDITGDEVRAVLREIEAAATRPGCRLRIEWSVEADGGDDGTEGA